MSSRCDLDHDVAVDDGCRVDGYGLGGRKRDRFTGLEAERASVLPALELHAVAVQLPLAERDVGVTAGVADGVDPIVDAHDSDRATVDIEPPHRARLQRRQRGDDMTAHPVTTARCSLEAMRARSSPANAPTGS